MLDPVARDEPGLLPQRVGVDGKLKLPIPRRKSDGSTAVDIRLGGRICSFTSNSGVIALSGCM